MPTGQSQSEPMRRYREMLRDIRDRTGLATLKDLEGAGIGSRSTLSRVFRGETRAPDDVLKALCGSARAGGAELDLLKNLRDEAFDSDGHAAEDVNEDRDVAVEETAGTPGGNQHREFTTVGTRSASSRLFGRKGGRWVLAAVAGVVGIAGSTIIFIIQQWGSSSLPSPDCAKYEVTVPGNIVDDAGNGIGTVSPKDVFIVDRSPGHPQLRYRYYGTVENQGVSGHVLQNKLNPLRSCT